MTNEVSRRWAILATIGCALVTLTLIVVALVIVDKKHFGWMVGSAFLGVITSGVMLGAVLVLIAAWKWSRPWTWRGIVLLVWALIALTSPLFGIMFLLPWGVLAITLPLVIVILVQRV